MYITCNRKPVPLEGDERNRFFNEAILIKLLSRKGEETPWVSMGNKILILNYVHTMMLSCVCHIPFLGNLIPTTNINQQ
jgi:hypothetical protein